MLSDKLESLAVVLELFFEFSRVDVRDDCAVTLLRCLESIKYTQDLDILDEEENANSETAKVEHQLLQEARQESHAEHEIKMPKIISDIGKSTIFLRMIRDATLEQNKKLIP